MKFVRPWHRAILAAAAVLGIAAAHAPSQEPLCDPELSRVPDTRWKYQVRGDRCEGLYARGLSSNPELRVVGLSAPPPRVDVRRVARTLVRWRPVPGQRLRIRAEGLAPMKYYRMDTVRPGAATPYAWPTAVLTGVSLQLEQVGLLAWVDDGGPEHARVHLPVRMDTAFAARAVPEYRLTVLPGTRLVELRYTLRRRLPDGRYAVVGAPDIDVGRPGYPEFRSVDIPLRAPDEAGEYEVVLAGRRESGGWVPARLRFRHVGEPF